MVCPTNIDELITYLEVFPKVEFTWIENNVVKQTEDRFFDRYEDSRIYWTNYAFTPINCTMGGRIESHLTFSKTKFVILLCSLSGEEIAQFHFHYKD